MVNSFKEDKKWQIIRFGSAKIQHAMNTAATQSFPGIGKTDKK